MVEPESGRVPDRGQAIPVLLVVIAFTAACAVGVARVGAAAVAAARAQTAADAAALAGVSGGRPAAAALAARNGARIVEWRPDPAAGDAGVTVTVSLVADPTVRASARAAMVP